MEEWIRDTFQIVEKRFERWSDNEVYYVDGFQFGNIILPIDSFLNHTGEVEAPPTYDDLLAIDPEDKRGWHTYYEQWYNDGLLR